MREYIFTFWWCGGTSLSPHRIIINANNKKQALRKYEEYIANQKDYSPGYYALNNIIEMD